MRPKREVVGRYCGTGASVQKQNRAIPFNVHKAITLPNLKGRLVQLIFSPPVAARAQGRTSIPCAATGGLKILCVRHLHDWLRRI